MAFLRNLAWLLLLVIVGPLFGLFFLLSLPVMVLEWALGDD